MGEEVAPACTYGDDTVAEEMLKNLYHLLLWPLCNTIARCHAEQGHIRVAAAVLSLATSLPPPLPWLCSFANP
ncbi:hypothetical protein OsI_32554 [Oryza sativa Indica Group]|uniref:Uncharacterized protein n=1 Tax=Oryza sativa subsp. indica TaxID=39946 RepID=A2Z4H3_ORYSI|nr:hypothetical protein OsI_32554 [Oryza sativa Indica Group]